MVLKSDGAGLYATKDLALARRKFEEFKIDQSVYVVDAAQTLHFQQVFKVLELMGYEQAKYCVHLPYGQVVLPSGKMSSRVGNVIYFSQLKKLLEEDIMKNYLGKYADGADTSNSSATTNSVDVPSQKTYVKTERNTDGWNSADISKTLQAISVATIKFGMLHHDTTKDVVFVLNEWTSKSGQTGPYMLYAYTRIQSICREVEASGLLDPNVKPDYSLLSDDQARVVLFCLHEFWPTIDSCVQKNNPVTLTDYLFDLSKAFSSWYDNKSNSILKAETPQLRTTRLNFVKSIAAVIKLGLNLLGIKTVDRM